jgi:predicted P-loop ATPase
MFMDDLGDIGAKDTLERLQGKWLIEIGELASLNRAEAAHIKAFLSRRVDTFRASYGRLPADYPRQGVFCGSVNPGSLGYLKDETGARRFWPIACCIGWPKDRRIDVAALRAERDQLLAEAVVAFLAGEPWWLDSYELEQRQAAAAEERYEVDTWEPAVAAFLETQQTAQVSEILSRAVGRQPKEQTRADALRIGGILKRLGWVPKAVRIDGKVTRRFVNPASNVVELRSPDLGELSA